MKTFQKQTYTEADFKWFKDIIAKLKEENSFNGPGIKKSDFMLAYTARFHKTIGEEYAISLLKRMENPEKAKNDSKRYAENEKLRAQGIDPVKNKNVTPQNIGDILTKHPFIIVIRNQVAGYETEEQVVDAIVNSQVSTDLMKMFEVKERKIKSQKVVTLN